MHKIHIGDKRYEKWYRIFRVLYPGTATALCGAGSSASIYAHEAIKSFDSKYICETCLLLYFVDQQE